MGEPVPDLPIFRGELPGRGILTPFQRLVGHRALYHWYHLRDEKL